MTNPHSFDAPDLPRAPSTPDAVPTWRDLPQEPPYGPVLPPRTRNLGLGFAPVVVEEGASVSPGQIALAVGGIVVLIVVGIGAALLLLGDDETAVADVVVDQRDPDPAEDGAFAPLPPAVAPQPAPDAPQGELLPQDPPGGQAPAPEPDSGSPEAPAAPEPDSGSSEAPAAPGAPNPLLPDDPGTADAPASEEGEVDLPRLFRLRTLPSGTAEDSTTIRQTTRDDEVVTEQVTMLTAEEGEIGVRATRGEDVTARLAEVQGSDGVEELSVRGLPAYLLEGQQLVWLLPGEIETLIEIDAPSGVGTDALLTIAQGLELLR